MRIKTLTMVVPLALFFLAAAQTARAQKDGEPQFVLFDENNRPTLNFTNKRAGKVCGLFVSYTLMDNQEEALVVRAAHAHFGYVPGVSLPEKGWLYITPSRIVFTVEEGDKSHELDITRADLKDKPATPENVGDYAALQLNLRERLPASESREQKFAFPIIGYKKNRCYIRDPWAYPKFLARAVKDFNGAMAEFKQTVASLKQAGKFHQATAAVAPPGSSANLTADASGDTGVRDASPDPGQESHGNAGVDITSEPAGAEIYVDGRLSGSTPSKIFLGVGEHTIKVTRPGYKDWERKILVEQGGVKALNATLEKQ